MGVLFVIAVITAVALMVYWIIGDVRMVTTLRSLPKAREGIALADADPPSERVCVIVPAHNEEDVIAGLIESLRAQDYPHMRVVIALDRCTDRTKEIALAEIDGDERFEILVIEECPDDWAGKVHAVWVGVTRSEAARDAQVYLFTDADTIFHPSLVRATTALLRDRGLGMLSLWSNLSCSHWFEWLVQPACGIELMYQYPLMKANRLERRRAFANGQFIMFSREAYEKIGGHEAVNEAVLEDMALARLVDQARIPAGVLLADGLLTVRMYDSWRAFRVGWKRIYIDCAKFKVSRLFKHAWRIRGVSIAMPLVTLTALLLAIFVPIEPTWLRIAGGLLASLSMGVWLGNLAFIYGRGGFPLWAIPLYPIGSLLASRIMTEAGRELKRREPVRWGGKEYYLEPR